MSEDQPEYLSRDEKEKIQEEIDKLLKNPYIDFAEPPWYNEQVEPIHRKIKNISARMLKAKTSDKAKEEVLIGRIHWKENLIDEETFDVVAMAKSRIVKINGKWL